ncbi:hypothetical protein Fmac_008087 [Flemingia macrophylla]|uniref:Uncharacterized protein n=1 Tax=Flemingia macrophylla TaxID=520843 RepID=A0ABD1MWF6_9FABA
MTWNRMEFSGKADGKIIEVGDPVYVLRKVSFAAEAVACTAYVESISEIIRLQ